MKEILLDYFYYYIKWTWKILLKLFMNSILQSYMTQSFRKFVIQLKFTDQSLYLIPHASKLSSLQKLYLLLTYQKQGYCSPYELIRQLREPFCNTNDQLDVSEFLHYFLEDLLDLLPKNLQIPLERIFFDIIDHRQPTYRPQEKFLGIDLYFNDEEDNQDLYDMIRKAYEKEQIEFTCDRCIQKTDKVNKSQQLIQLPSVLFMIVHRFTFNIINQKNVNKSTIQSFELNLEISLINKNQIVEIVSMNLCIYYPYGVWVTFDDTMISNLEYDSDQLLKELIYLIYNIYMIYEETPNLLFYQNQSSQPLILNN
ncbi:unnamed protein product [Paramecium sonneborni]|uniref:USP domain-containing protein n=1 Tax=Paramecium sonneborni TaxID=65129 RepID=A0A8S1RNR6_9CILI|nr:unnamed protein product [Paramecium sonneborni]